MEYLNQESCTAFALAAMPEKQEQKIAQQMIQCLLLNHAY
jgi:hypothetical protein